MFDVVARARQPTDDSFAHTQRAPGRPIGHPGAVTRARTNRDIAPAVSYFVIG